MCKEKGCKIKPVFNKEGETNGLYCNTHKINFVRPPKVLGIKFKKNYTNLVLKKYYLKKIM